MCNENSLKNTLSTSIGVSVDEKLKILELAISMTNSIKDVELNYLKMLVMIYHPESLLQDEHTS